jgi:histidinol-phosphate aminotransferase
MAIATTSIEESPALSENLMIDLNEMPYRPPEDVIKAVQKGVQQLNRYADEHDLSRLTALLGEYAGVEQKQIVIGPGSDLLHREIVLCFGGSRKVVLVSPTFLPTLHVAARFARKVVSIRLDRPDFTLARSSLLSELREPTLLVIDNPNNPTGKLIVDREIVDEILKKPDTLLVVDEVYFEFSGLTFAEETEFHGNLAVVRTLDKAFGLAGARIGYLVAGQAFLGSLSAASSFLSRPSLAAAIAALRHRGYMWNNVQRIVQERERVSQELALQGDIVYPSSTNFLLVNSGIPFLAGELRKRGVAVMDVSNELGPGFIRVNLGTPEDNDAFLRAFRTIRHNPEEKEIRHEYDIGQTS